MIVSHRTVVLQNILLSLGTDDTITPLTLFPPEVRPALRLWLAIEFEATEERRLPGPLELWEPYLDNEEWWFEHGISVAANSIDLAAHYRAIEGLNQEHGIPHNAHHLLNPAGDIVIYTDSDVEAGYSVASDLDPDKLREALARKQDDGKFRFITVFV